MQENAMANPI